MAARLLARAAAAGFLRAFPWATPGYYRVGRCQRKQDRGLTSCLRKHYHRAMSLKDEIERVFGAWLTWSRDEEILALLDLVVAALRRRSFQVNLEITRSSGKQDEPGG